MTTAGVGGKAGTKALPPELLGSLPRDVRLTGGGIAVAVVAAGVAVAALLLSIGMTLVAMRTEAEHQRRVREGVSAQAAVVSVQRERGENPRRIVTYRYEVDGIGYTGRQRLRQRDRRDLASGATVSITYVQSEPGTSWMAGYGENGFPLFVIPLIALGMLGAAALIARSVRRQWILLSEGRPAQAVITGVKKVYRHGHEKRGFRLNYEFRTLSGARQTSRCDTGKTSPPVGSVIPIVYHRDRPDWSAMYPLELVRPGRLVQ